MDRDEEEFSWRYPGRDLGSARLARDRQGAQGLWRWQHDASESSIKLEPYSDLRLGGTVGFDSVGVGLDSREYPMYTVRCYQDLDGTGIHQWPDGGSDLVYSEMRKPMRSSSSVAEVPFG